MKRLQLSSSVLFPDISANRVRISNIGKDGIAVFSHIASYAKKEGCNRLYNTRAGMPELGLKPSYII